jgi:tetratricopeptide (TPR) repeat protein
MGKKKHIPAHLLKQAVEQFTDEIEEITRAKNLYAPEEVHYWLQKQTSEKKLGECCGAASRIDLAKAQYLVLKNADEPSERKRVSTAAKALQISVDCGDAYVVLGDYHAPYNRPEAEERYRQGIAAGQRAVGTLKTDHAAFWNDFETRPLMRAVNALASLLQDYGEVGEAIELWQELFRLNPNDDQNVHLRLVPALVAEERFEEAKELMDRYRLESAAALAYSLALMLFKQNGDTDEAREALHKAMETNGSVIRDLLIGTHTRLVIDMKHPAEVEAEAMSYAPYACADWEDTEGAIDWVAQTVKESIQKQVRKLSIAKTFPGLKFADEAPDMLKILGGIR